MFPGMGRGPEPLPDQESTTVFWRSLNRFVGFSLAAIAVSLGVRYVESKAESIILGAI
jgi:hypothetical protein